MEETQTLVKEKTAIQELLELPVAKEEKEIFVDEAAKMPDRFTRAFQGKNTKVFISTPSGKNPFKKIWDESTARERRQQLQGTWEFVGEAQSISPPVEIKQEHEVERTPAPSLTYLDGHFAWHIFSATCMPSRIALGENSELR